MVVSSLFVNLDLEDQKREICFKPRDMLEGRE